MKIKLSKNQWENIGKKAGWMKQSGGWGRYSDDIDGVISAQVIQNKGKKPEEILAIIKGQPDLVQFLATEDMTDEDLLLCIKESQMMYLR